MMRSRLFARAPVLRLCFFVSVTRETGHTHINTTRTTPQTNNHTNDPPHPNTQQRSKVVLCCCEGQTCTTRHPFCCVASSTICAETCARMNGALVLSKAAPTAHEPCVSSAASSTYYRRGVSVYRRGLAPGERIPEGRVRAYQRLPPRHYIDPPYVPIFPDISLTPS